VAKVRNAEAPGFAQDDNGRDGDSLFGSGSRDVASYVGRE